MTKTKPRTCNLPGCEEPAVERGLCESHWWTHRGLADPERETSDG